MKQMRTKELHGYICTAGWLMECRFGMRLFNYIFVEIILKPYLGRFV